jgi:hypothetical protein
VRGNGARVPVEPDETLGSGVLAFGLLILAEGLEGLGLFGGGSLAVTEFLHTLSEVLPWPGPGLRAYLDVSRQIHLHGLERCGTQHICRQPLTLCTAGHGA